MHRPLAVLLALLALPLAAQEPPDHDVPLFTEYDPPSTLVVPEHRVPRAKYPFIDVHNHQWQMPDQNLAELTAAMDGLNMAVMVNLSGRGFRRVEDPDGTARFGVQDGEFLARSLANVAQNAPGRIVLFTNLDLEGFGSEGWEQSAVAQLVADVQHGARGLKIYKNLGMDAKDTSGVRIAVDDPRLDSVWAKCGELGIPVLIHSADPAPFWQPKDRDNERLYELMERPERYRDPALNPPFELPNVYTEIGAVIAELGRQPRFARDWLIRYQDRVMFGKDTWAVEEYPTYFQILETNDDYVKYFRRRHAFWRIYGLDLPDQVLRKIYYENALRVIPGLDRSLFPS